MTQYRLPTRLTKPFRVVDTQYTRELEEAADIIFDRACFVLDWDWTDLAKEANLSYNTVARLGNRITQLPRWQTIWKLACAVGLKMSFVDRDGQVLAPATQLRIYKEQSKAVA